MKALIQKLTEAYGPSGYEKEVRAIVTAEIKGAQAYTRFETDALGNLIAVVGQKAKGGKRVMLAAHMDEIGVIVSHIDANGFARFQNIGGVRAANCIGTRVRFGNGLTGVIGMDDKRDDANRMPTLSELYIDVGATSAKDCPIKVGDPAIFWRPFEAQGTRLIAKSMDDRIGVAILIETLKQFKNSPHEVAFVFTIQEEVGIRGASTAAFSVDADLDIAIDVTRTGDTPNGIKMAVALGQGPAIKVRDSGMLADPRIKDLMVQRATEAKLPYQLEILEAGTTDAAAMQIARGGVPAGCISIPTRYIHSPSEMVDERDVQQCVQLLLEILRKPIEL